LPEGQLKCKPDLHLTHGPSLELPLFEGGSLRANLRFTQATYEEMVADYRQTEMTVSSYRLNTTVLLKVCSPVCTTRKTGP
jgi:hypothetical protein